MSRDKLNPAQGSGFFNTVSDKPHVQPLKQRTPRPNFMDTENQKCCLQCEFYDNSFCRYFPPEPLIEYRENKVIYRSMQAKPEKPELEWCHFFKTVSKSND